MLGGGLGHYIVKNERTQFQVFGGGSYNRENFSNGVKRNSGEILAGEELSLKLSDRVLFRRDCNSSRIFPTPANIVSPSILH